MQMNPKVKKILDIVTSILVALSVLLAVFLMGARLIGLQVFSVSSGSMTPEYLEHDLIYVKIVKPESIQVDDVITFVLNEELTVATHRVVRIDSENRKFYTKGDANKTEDTNPVLFENLIGTPVFRIPLLGSVSEYIQKPPGMYVAIGGGLLLIAAVFLPDLFKKKEEEKEEEDVHEKEDSCS